MAAHSLHISRCGQDNALLYIASRQLHHLSLWRSSSIGEISRLTVIKQAKGSQDASCENLAWAFRRG